MKNKTLCTRYRPRYQALALLAAPLFLLSPAAAQTSDPHPLDLRVKSIIHGLASDLYKEREDAVKNLLELPAEALPYLDAALADTSDPEVSIRIQANIERLRSKARINSKALRAKILGAWETAAATKGYADSKSKKTAPTPNLDAFVKEAFAQIPALRDGGRPGDWKLYPKAAFIPFKKAVDAGSEDPLLLACYLDVGFHTAQLNVEPAKKILPKLYPAILESTYHPALQLQVVLDYVDALDHIDPEAELWTPAERAGALRAAIAAWPEIVQDQHVPEVALELLAERYSLLAVKYGADRTDPLEPLFDPWLKARPKSAGPFSLKTSTYVEAANDISRLHENAILSDDKLAAFNHNIRLASEAAEEAYKRDVTSAWAATAMVKACSLSGEKQDVMEKWYARATEADPDNFEACKFKLKFLRDFVGHDQTLAFARQCVAGNRWQGPMPLALIQAHRLLVEHAESPAAAMAYLESEPVWSDVQTTYKKFLAVHKGDAFELFYRSSFALDACLAGKWTAANEQFKFLGETYSPAIFPSRGTYNYWKRKALAAASEK